VLRRTFGPKKDEVTVEYQILPGKSQSKILFALPTRANPQDYTASQPRTPLSTLGQYLKIVHEFLSNLLTTNFPAVRLYIT
jgi:hypothetical protein